MMGIKAVIIPQMAPFPRASATPIQTRKAMTMLTRGTKNRMIHQTGDERVNRHEEQDENQEEARDQTRRRLLLLQEPKQCCSAHWLLLLKEMGSPAEPVEYGCGRR